MKKLCLLSTCVVALIVASSSVGAPGGTRHVSTTGTDTGTCISSPCLTIGYAVGQAAPGDAVEVAAGTYAESVEVTKQLTLSGSAATIDATGHDNGILISGPAAAGTKVRGFTVEHADLEGILAQMTSHLVIADNTVVDNDLAGIGSPKCQSQDDCGEGLHLLSVTGSIVSGNSVHDNIGGILLTDEAGPTAWNLIVGNTVNDNVKDCGITLASHFFSLAGPASPSAGGVYQNLVTHNTANGNGSAGIGFFAGPPGAAAWDNAAIDNTANGNGLPGVAIHSHTPGQNANGNIVVGNRLAGNGPDDDANTDGPTGIAVFSAVTPITGTLVAANRIADEHLGIYISNASVSGLRTNRFVNVDIPISIN
jgi:parallel beta-helix repeat protein